MVYGKTIAGEPLEDLEQLRSVHAHENRRPLALRQSGLRMRGAGRDRCTRGGKGSPLLLRRGNEKEIRIAGAHLSGLSSLGRNTQGHRSRGVDGARLFLRFLARAGLATIAGGPRSVS